MRLFVALVVVVVGVLLWVGWLVGIASDKAGAQSRSLTFAPTVEGPRQEFGAVGGWVAASNASHSGGTAVQNTTTTAGDPLTITATSSGTLRIYGVHMTATRTIRHRTDGGAWTSVPYSAAATAYQALVATIPVDDGDVVEIERVTANSVTLDFWTIEPPAATTTTTAPATTTTTAPATTTTTAPATTTTTAPATTTTTAPGTGTGTGSAAPAPTSVVVTCGLLLFLGSLHVVASWRSR